MILEFVLIIYNNCLKHRDIRLYLFTSHRYDWAVRGVERPQLRCLVALSALHAERDRANVDT